MTDLQTNYPQATNTAMNVVPVTPEVKDFSKGNAPIAFTIDDDTFYAPARIPAQTLIDFTKMFDGLSENKDLSKTIEAFKATIRLVLMPDSATLFEQRMADLNNPIDLGQVNEVIPWLMEQYGLRPTEPSENSSDGQPNPESGTPSTETPQPEASTSSISQLIDSST